MSRLEGFVDAWVAAGQPEAAGSTCRGGTLSTGQRIDYGFISSAYALNIRRAWMDERAEGSDHQPIWTEIDL